MVSARSHDADAVQPGESETQRNKAPDAASTGDSLTYVARSIISGLRSAIA
jgi:hypothetical protein